MKIFLTISSFFILLNSCNILNSNGMQDENYSIKSYPYNYNKYIVDVAVKDVVELNNSLKFNYLEQYASTESFTRWFSITILSDKYSEVIYLFSYYGDYRTWPEKDSSLLFLRSIFYDCKTHKLDDFKGNKKEHLNELVNLIDTYFINELNAQVTNYSQLKVKPITFFPDRNPSKILFVDPKNGNCVDTLIIIRPVFDETDPITIPCDKIK